MAEGRHRARHEADRDRRCRHELARRRCRGALGAPAPAARCENLESGSHASKAGVIAMMALSTRLLAATAFGLAILSGAVPALAAKDRLVVDLVNEPSSLDPHVQWNPDSYYVYRNVFDNLVTRDDAGKIMPQIETSWKYLSDTQIEFQLRSDVKFHDGSKLTAEDVAYSVQRITDPKFASPQLGQFDQIIK